MKFFVTATSAVSEPRTTATTTTSLAGFLDGATFGAYGSACRRRGGCWYSWLALVEETAKRLADAV